MSWLLLRLQNTRYHCQSTLQTGAVCSSRMLKPVYQSIRCNIPEDCKLNHFTGLEKLFKHLKMAKISIWY